MSANSFSFGDGSSFEAIVGEHLRNEGVGSALPETLNTQQVRGVLDLMGELNAEVVEAHGAVDPFSVADIHARFARGETPTPDEFEQAVRGAQQFGAYQMLSDIVQRFGEAINTRPPQA